MQYSTLEHFKILSHINRPNAKTYIESIFTSFIELNGDRLFGNDPSIIGGIAYLDRIPVTIIGQLRGNNICENIKYNFSMAHPEGFRKALRLMKQAEKFHRPIICFVDTIGAYPGKQAEERGQAIAIANNLIGMMYLRVPIITVLIGYGCSGGALALCVADRLVALEHSTLSVISPKACAEILWKDHRKNDEAVNMLGMMSDDLYELGIVDYIINEPPGGAHNNVTGISSNIKDYLVNEIQSLRKERWQNLINKRIKKFRSIGGNDVRIRR